MDGFGTSDILTGRGLGLFGFPGTGWGMGMGMGMYPGAGFQYGDSSANAARIVAVGDSVANQNEFTRELAQSDIEGIRNSFDMLAAANEFQTTRKEMTDGFTNIANANLQNTIMGGQAALANERRQSDLFMNLNNQINDFRAEAAKCCCDTKLLIIEKSAATDALINQRFLETEQAKLADAQRQIQTQTIINALRPAPVNGGAVAATCL